MKSMKMTALIAALVMIAGTAKAELKVGYVDLQKAIQTTSAGKKAKADLEKEVEAKKKVLQEKEKDIKKMSEDFEKKSMVLSDDVRGKKQAEIQEEMLKWRDNAQKTQLELQNKERDLTQPILEKLKSAIEKVSKDKGLSMVFERSEHSVVWAEPGLDITGDVVKKFETLK